LFAVFSERLDRAPLPWLQRGICIALRHPADPSLAGHLLLSAVAVVAGQAEFCPGIMGFTALACRWEDIRWYSNGKRDWATCYVRTENVPYCDQSANFWVHPYPEQIVDFGHGPDLNLQQKLDYLKQHRLNLFYEAGSK
jgi:hypothetical protein